MLGVCMLLRVLIYCTYNSRLNMNYNRHRCSPKIDDKPNSVIVTNSFIIDSNGNMTIKQTDINSNIIFKSR